jgi:hypothetical protein
MRQIVIIILTIIYLIVFSAGTIAQQQKGRVELSPAFESKYTGGKFVGWSDKYYYEAIFGRGGRVYFRKYDKKLNLVSETNLPFNADKDKSLTAQGMTVVNGKLLFFTSRVDKKTKTQTFYYQQINNKNELSSPVQMIKTDFDDETRIDNSGISYKVSERQNFLMVYQLVPAKKSENEKLNVYVFDQDMNLFWKKSVTLDYSAKNTAIENYDVSDVGSAYIRIMVERADKEVKEVADKRSQEKAEGVKQKKRTQQKAHFIYAFTPGGEQTQKYMIDLGNEGFPTDINTSFNADGIIAVGGFYADANNTNSIQGTFYLTIDPSQKEAGKPRIQRIPEASRRLLVGNRAVNKGKDASLGTFEVRYFQPQNDGGSLLVAEEHYMTSYTDKKQNRIFVYHYDDILIVRFDAEGNVKWSNVIKKSQALEEPEYTFDLASFAALAITMQFMPRIYGPYSFGLQVVDDHVYILYNDNIDNLDASKQKTNSAGDIKVKPFDPYKKAAASVLAIITPDGNMQREELLQRKDRMGIIAPREVMSVEDENVLITQTLTGGNKIRLVRIHLK